MNVLDAEFVKGFIRMADDGWNQGWHERNGGNLTYRIKKEEVESIREELVPGGRDIAVATSGLMKQYDVVIWAHHGMFCSGENFNLTFRLMHTVEKSAEILVKVRSMQSCKRQTIQPEEFRHLAVDFGVKLPEKFLYDKD